MEPISREEVLNILNDTCNHALKVYDKKYHLPIRTITLTATKQIDRLQTIESRPKGKWIQITQGAIPEQYMCPFCHRTVSVYDNEVLFLSMHYPYCHCGAYMSGEEK